MFNYHTHTYRCGHAVGTDREYVENAIKGGLTTLGFSDHAPYIFPDGYRSSFRMSSDMLCDYAQSVRALKKEYANDIEILLGFELEYYPLFHKEEMAFLNTVKPDYIILSQHFVGNEKDTLRHVYNPGEDVLCRYVSQIIEGINTGDFNLLGHPDIINTESTPKDVYEREFARLCKYALQKNFPIELNLLGISAKRHYPSDNFFKIAGQIGAPIVVAYDAHNPQSFLDNTVKPRLNYLIETYDLKIIERPFIKAL